MQTFLMQGAVQPPNIHKHVKTKIGPEIKHFQVVKCKIFIGRAGMQPPENKFRLKRCLKLSIW